jgi:hypothetical protein
MLDEALRNPPATNLHMVVLPKTLLRRGAKSTSIEAALWVAFVWLIYQPQPPFHQPLD